MIIVTGGAGFIGSVLVDTLNRRGYEDIIVVDEMKTSDKWKNLRNKKLAEYYGINEFTALMESKRLPQKVEAIFHMGACSSTTEKDVDYLLSNNYRFSASIADFAASVGARFIYASSAATYGAGEIGYADTLPLLKLKPLNPYGFSKYLFDLWMEARGFQNNAVGIKFFNVYGPNEYHKGEMCSVPFKAHDRIAETGKFQLFKSNTPTLKDGEQRRDFVYVKDCCEVMLWFLEHPELKGIFNLGTGMARTWNDLITAVFHAMSRTPSIEYIDMPLSISRQYQNYTCAEMNKLSQAGCKVKFHSLEDGVKDYVSNYLSKEDRYL